MKNFIIKNYYIQVIIYILEILKNASTTIRKLIEGGSEDLHNYPFINELIYTPKLDLTNKNCCNISRSYRSVYSDKVLNFNASTHLCRVLRMKEIDSFDKYIDFIEKYKNVDLPQYKYMEGVKIDYIIPIEKLDEFILNNTSYKSIKEQTSNSNFEISNEQKNRIIELYKEDYNIPFKIYTRGKI